jgi:hypothetical protein
MHKNCLDFGGKGPLSQFSKKNSLYSGDRSKKEFGLVYMPDGYLDIINAR